MKESTMSLREIISLFLFITFSENLPYCLSLDTSSVQSGGASLLQFLGLKQAPEDFRPKIYTFIFDENPSVSFQEDELIRLWAESWSHAGYDPVVLTDKDASSHPNYKEFISTLVESNIEKGDRWGRYLRYIAMSTRDEGGWYSEPYVLPLHSDLSDKVSKELPNNGRFTMHEKDLPELLSGNKKEWNKMAFSMLQKPDKNDVMVLTNLLREYPDLYIVESSVIHAKYILDSNLNADVCEVMKDNIAAKFSYRIANDAGITRNGYYNAVKSSLASLSDKCGIPKMHTFFEPAYRKHDRLLTELEAWKKAWSNAGWKPVVLTMEDAKRHPNFERFNIAFEEAEYKTSKYDRMCFYRWLAMASTSNGGWMSDYDTYPLFSNPKNHGIQLPNGGKFTCYANHVPCLISGSLSEWQRMSELLLFSYQMHTKEFWSDMLALEEIRSTLGGYIGLKETVTADQPYRDMNLRGPSNLEILDPYSLKDACESTKGKRAIHFSHASCKRAKFCDGKRDTVLGKWIEAWTQQCRA